MASGEPTKSPRIEAETRQETEHQMDTIATLAVMAILAACAAAGMVGNDNDAMEA